MELDLIGAAIAQAVKAADLRAEGAKLADAAEFHAAVSRAYLRDFTLAEDEGEAP